MNILSLNPRRVKRFTKQACRVNVVVSFFPLKIFIPLCLNVLSTVPHENRLADSLYISIYLSILFEGNQIRENKWIYLEANHLSVFLVISYFFFNLCHFQLFETTNGAEYRKEKVEVADFFVNKHVDELILNTEVRV